jgi:hypothetical protein
MNVKTRFPFFYWLFSTLTGRWARRSYVAILLLLLCLTTAVRLRAYLMTRRIQAVLHGLAAVRVDQTTEEQLPKIVPYLTRSAREWKTRGTVQRSYSVDISNASDRLLGPFIAYRLSSIRQLAYWLGYRFIGFDAGVLVRDGKVSSVEYGLATLWGAPRAATYIVSARSVHGFYLPLQMGFGVSSEDDESPRYRVKQGRVPSPDNYEGAINVTFTNDAPPELVWRAFRLNLGCFWRLRGCEDARDIAPELWQDAQNIQTATVKRLEAGKCPDSIVDARMRYLPDVSVFLLEVKGSRRIKVNEQGYETEDWFTDYELKEVIRGRSFGDWKNVRLQRTIPLPGDPMRTMMNQIYPPTKVGSQVLFFGHMDFESCRMIPATPTTLEIVRNTPVPMKRPEDEIQRGLL